MLNQKEYKSYFVNVEYDFSKSNFEKIW
jgi:hypothetical protein